MLILDEYFERLKVSPQEMDELWAQGWRHFGTYFFRYSTAYHYERLCRVMPLRIDVRHFTLSRSQKRVLAKNRDVEVVIRSTKIDREKVELFYQHRERFKENVPDSLFTFISGHPLVPCKNIEINVYSAAKLIAVSFLDIGKHSTSAVYSMFDLKESKRSLGIFTMLQAIRYTEDLGYRFYYPGYAYYETSVYDYKKNFAALEYLDWRKGWLALNHSTNNEP